MMLPQKNYAADVSIPAELRDQIATVQKAWAARRHLEQQTAAVVRSLSEWIRGAVRQVPPNVLIETLREILPVTVRHDGEVELEINRPRAHFDDPLSVSAVLWQRDATVVMVLALHVVSVSSGGGEILGGPAPFVAVRRHDEISYLDAQELLRQTASDIAYQTVAFVEPNGEGWCPDIVVSGAGGAASGARLWQLQLVAKQTWRIVWDDSWLFAKSIKVDVNPDRVTVVWGHDRWSAKLSKSVLRLHFGRPATATTEAARSRISEPNTWVRAVTNPDQGRSASPNRSDVSVE